MKGYSPAEAPEQLVLSFEATHKLWDFFELTAEQRASVAFTLFCNIAVDWDRTDDDLANQLKAALRGVREARQRVIQ